MIEKFQIFEVLYNDEELEFEFNNFFHKYGLSPLFTNEYRSTGITVAYVDARSVINTGGSYHKTLLDFTDFILIANDNKSYEEALFKIIYEPRTFQRFINLIRKIMNFINNEINTEDMGNMWNIVFYNKEIWG